MVDDSAATKWNLGSDVPVSDPSEDAYGYAAFAAQIAQAIIETEDPQGLVLTIHGEWGAGKTSLLNFIRHDLKAVPEEKRPILVTFNPWWFEGREQIAAQLLEEFAAQLPGKLKVVRKAAAQIGKYAKLITATASSAATYSGHPWFGIPIAWLGRFISPRSKGIPALKKQTADALAKIGKRFVFLVDDIDRLTPDEARDFFRAIKALADFPEVVYVLFFDRVEVAKALTTSLQMDGDSYLEKLVQAPFHLPTVDKDLLRKRLFGGLDTIFMSSKSMPFPYDRGRWGQMFFGGLDHYVRKPRDVVRILNAISVTYPPLAGEVNPVDFIALEVLRLFEPDVYATIRDGKEFFCGRTASFGSENAAEKTYFEKWQGRLPDRSREAITLLVSRMFPRVARSLGKNYLTSSSEQKLRQELRPCSLECFDVYFRFSVPIGYVTRAELDRLVSQNTAQEMAALLLDAAKHVFPDGHSKARDLIDRLRDTDDDLRAEQAAKLVDAIVSNGHLLLGPDDERGGILASLPNSWRVLGLTTDLLERVPTQARQGLLLSLAKSSPGIWLLVHLADMAEESTRDPSKAPKAMGDLDSDFSARFATIVAQRLDTSGVEDLMLMPELYFIVHWWGSHADRAEVRGVFEPAVKNDDRLLKLLDKFVTTGWRDSGSGATEIYRLAMEPLGVVMDLDINEARVRELQARIDLDRRKRAAVNGYLKGLQRIREGKNPDGRYLDDEDG